MTSASVVRIEGQLEARFNGLIDMSDLATRPPEQQKNAFLSRALAALCVKAIANTDAPIAAKAVTDGYSDNGLDAVYFNHRSDELLIVQSKWSNDGISTLDAKVTLVR